jgi:hypothetical protein
MGGTEFAESGRELTDPHAEAAGSIANAGKAGGD